MVLANGASRATETLRIDRVLLIRNMYTHRHCLLVAQRRLHHARVGGLHGNLIRYCEEEVCRFLDSVDRAQQALDAHVRLHGVAV
jgi:hypothetical protein